MTSRGRPKWEPTDKDRKLVESMAAIGIPHADIARVLGISENTLRKRCKHELATSAAKANAAVGGALYRNALSGNVAAQIFWAKTRMGWRETAPKTPEGPGPESDGDIVLERGPDRFSTRSGDAGSED